MPNSLGKESWHKIIKITTGLGRFRTPGYSNEIESPFKEGQHPKQTINRSQSHNITYKATSAQNYSQLSMMTPADKIPNSTSYNGTRGKGKIENNEIKFSKSYRYPSNSGGNQNMCQKGLQHYKKTNVYLTKRSSCGQELEKKWSQERHSMTYRNDLTKTTINDHTLIRPMDTAHNNKSNEELITFTHPITTTHNDIANMEEELEHSKIGITVWTTYQPEVKNEITEEVDPLSLVETTITYNDINNDFDKIPSQNLKCTKCNRAFPNKLARNKHILRQHIKILKPAPCPQCNAQSNDLNLHMREVHNVEGSICPYCTKTFSARTSLNRHIDTVHMHIQPHRPAPCPYCNKKLNQKQTLKKHIEVVHQGKRSYSDPCPHCGKIFTTERSLNIHISTIHLKQKKVKCNLCNKELSCLRSHMNTVHGVSARTPKIPLWAIEGLFTSTDNELDRTKQGPQSS